jgi:hypothetical protein
MKATDLGDHNDAPVRWGFFDGFHLGTGDVIFDDTLLLIAPEAAAAYEATTRPAEAAATTVLGKSPPPVQLPPDASRLTSLHATAEVPAATVKMRLVQIADEIRLSGLVPGSD